MDVAAGKVTKVDTDFISEGGMDFAWAPRFEMDRVCASLCPIASARSRSIRSTAARAKQVTDGMSDARHPVFDRDGQYLYFTASTNYGPTTSGLDMTSDEHEVTSSIYLMVLANNVASPLAPESDEEKPGTEGTARGEGGRGGRGGRGANAAANTPPSRCASISTRLSQRIIALPVPARRINRSRPGAPDMLYIMEGGGGARPGRRRRNAFQVRPEDAQARETGRQRRVVRPLGQWREDAAPHGRRRRRRRPGRTRRRDGAPAPQYVIVSAAAPVKPGEGALRLNDVEVNVDPIAEWKQMYHEVWRIERSYFYDPNLHGVNVADAEKEYEKYLDSLGSRADLNYIIHDMISDMTVGHLRGGGGNIPAAQGRSGRTAGRRLRDRQRPLSLQENLHRRELESAVAGSAGCARAERLRPAIICSRSNGAGTDGQGRRLAPARETAGKHVAAKDRARMPPARMRARSR